MKYKNIDSMLHNFGHSFVSLMNYLDGAYIVDELNSLLSSIPAGEFVIDFSSGALCPSCEYPERVRKSIHYWQTWLPKHMAGHNVSPTSLGPVLLRYRRTRFGPEVIVECTDDRGKAHQVYVRT